MVPTAQSVKEIFRTARHLQAPDERGVFLDEACQRVPGLRERLESLLAAAEQSGTNPLDAMAEAFGPADTVAPRITEAAGVEGCIQQIGPYTLLEQLGDGGMGVVYVAEQHEPIRRLVALKIIKPGMDSQQVVARFEAERQVLAMMHHPHIAKIFDAGTTDTGRPYFVMELVKGTPLTTFCDQHQLPLRARLELFVQVCQAVQHAHQKGVIHRDLKPSNILVESTDARAVPKVIDFGVAKATHQQLVSQMLQTGTFQMIGTPLYMSPEQAQQNSLDVDTRSDVYSLGVVLYELLTGTTPFDRDTLRQVGFDEMRRMIREDEPPRPSTRISTLQSRLGSTVEGGPTDAKRLSLALRQELDWIVMRALEKDRARRYDSASALADDVQRYLDGQAVLACPPTPWYRAKKLARRHGRLLVGTTLVVIALLLATGVSIWYAMVADQSWQLAEKRRTLVEVKNRELQASNRQLDATNQLLEERNRAIAAAEALSRSNFDLAKSAVGDLVVRVARHELAGFPEHAQLRTGLLTRARDFYSNLIQANPQDHSLFVQRAEIWRLLRDDHSALQDYQRALALAPEDGDTLVSLADFFWNPNDHRIQDLRRAAQYLQRAQEMGLESAESWHMVAMLGDMTHEPLRKAYELEHDPAEKQLRLALWLSSKNDVAGALAAFDAALSRASHLDLRSKIRFGRAWMLVHRGRCEEAIAELTSAIEEDAFNHHHYALRAKAYEELAQVEKAIVDSERAVELSGGQCWWLRKRLALWHFQDQRFSAAIEQLGKAAEFNPADASTMTWIPLQSIVSCSDRAFVEGYKQLAQRFPTLNNGCRDGLLVSAVALAELGEMKAARMNLQAAVSSASGDSSYDSWGILLALQLDDMECARSICGQLFHRARTDKVPAHVFKMAWACTLASGLLDDYRPAIELAREGLAEDPKNAERLLCVAALCYRGEAYSEANQVLEQLEGTVATSSMSPAYHAYYWAMTQQHLGQTSAARATLQRANELAAQESADPAHPPAWNRHRTLERLRREAEG